jgi:hypothetical protein
VADLPVMDLTEAAELPPADLLKHMDSLHLHGCRCRWQLKPRTGWVRLNTEARCPHHDPKYRAGHLEETLRRIVPQDWCSVAANPDTAKLGEVWKLLWGPR